MADERSPQGPPQGGQDASARVDVHERAGHHTGNPQVLESRLFMQLLVFDCSEGMDPARAIDALASALLERKVSAVLYDDVNAPRRIGVLTWSEDPGHFVRAVRPALNAVIDGTAPALRGGAASHGLVQCHDLTMIGRTYATGYDADLRFWLLERPVNTALEPLWPWAVWYPLRRIGAFNRLEGREQGAIMREHASIGRAYGEQDLAHDIRLACHGLDANDNEFVIGLIGKELHPLSHVVQAMRKTRQTAEFMEHMGPFFVGHVAKRVVL